MWLYIYCVFRGNIKKDSNYLKIVLGVAIYIVWPYICTTGQISTMFNLYFEVKHVDGKIPTSFWQKTTIIFSYFF